eukprot:gnl/TRDRNA2_/TRDRNA2_162151_c0_seq2.p1 gnl/TRDRNA2_/TRDRNA2_162151_c0~~gnl/TRDRNA2_/TRDRNA2_162151_c0_seq2.p1  ORF type:complete len:251 (-),score=31.22 gnl/TRDRNA2_/TRDRNA2_162151_c0_seq2:83-835(-)
MSRSFGERRERRLSCDQRLRQLRSRAEQRHQHLADLRGKLDEARSRHAAETERLLQNRQRLREASKEHERALSELPLVYNGLRLLWQQLRCRQVRMVHEVATVYPIENCGRFRTVRGLCLPLIDTLSRCDLREEEGVSTALGFLAHFLVTIAGVLEVPLRIVVYHAGCSRSYLRDPHEATDPSTQAVRDWPLYYGRALEKQRFDGALRLLRDGLTQFLYSRGYYDEKRACSGNLLESAEMILQREIHGCE